MNGTTVVEAGAVIVAVGAHPEVPEPSQPVRALVRTHETIFEIEQLPSSLAMIDDTGVPLLDPATRRCGTGPVFVARDVDAWHPVLHEAARGGTVAGHVVAGGAALPPIPPRAIAFTEPNLVEVGLALDALPDRGMDAKRFADQAWYHPVIKELTQAVARDILRQME